MNVNLKPQHLKIDDIELEKIYVGSEKYLFYVTTLYVDNQITDENFRYVCVKLNTEGGNLIFKTKEDMWNTIGKFSLRKANFELNEI